MLTGWFGGPSVEQTEPREDALLSKALDSLSYVFGVSQTKIVSQCKVYSISNWQNDPFACGAYSYVTCNTADARRVLNKPVADTIYFAGEGIYDGPHTGTVEAALCSGKEAAIKIAGITAASLPDKIL
jgi:monoamine oxidase